MAGRDKARGDEPGPTLYAVIESYRRKLREQAKPRSASQAYTQSETILRYFGSHFLASHLSRETLDAFIADRLQKVEKVSCNGTLSVLRSALRHAVDCEKLERMPVKVKLLTVTRRRPRVLNPDQVKFLASCSPAPFDAMILIAGRCGLRHDEILRLQVQDVDFETRHIHVSAKHEWSPKNHQERSVPLPPKLAQRLRDHIEGLKDKSPAAWLFPGYDGQPRAAVHKPIREAFQAAGLYDPATKPGLHMLRRTFATEALGRGTDVETVRALGGWSSLGVVQRYVTTTDERMRQAVEAMEED